MKFSQILVPLSLQVAGTWAAVPGFDVSNWQGAVNMQGAYNSGARFVIIKATEGTGFIDPYFSVNYIAATNAGLIRGGYHYARPDGGSGAAQGEFLFFIFR